MAFEGIKLFGNLFEDQISMYAQQLADAAAADAAAAEADAEEADAEEVDAEEADAEEVDAEEADAEEADAEEADAEEADAEEAGAGEDAFKNLLIYAIVEESVGTSIAYSMNETMQLPVALFSPPDPFLARMDQALIDAGLEGGVAEAAADNL
jgi:uncharacterized protein YjbI with pentapeptide repeats